MTIGQISTIEYNSSTQITIEELEKIFDGGLPTQAFELLISPTAGMSLSEIRRILHSIADGTYQPPEVIIEELIISEDSTIEEIIFVETVNNGKQLIGQDVTNLTEEEFVAVSLGGKLPTVPKKRKSRKKIASS